MSATATGLAHCEKPERYIKQLVSHWGHKMATSYDEGDGMGTFPFSEHTSAVMTARPEGIAITLTAADKEENERMDKQISSKCAANTKSQLEEMINIDSQRRLGG